MDSFNHVFTADVGKFLANMANMAVDGAVTDIHITVIGTTHDGVAAENASWLPGKHLQHGKFSGCQIELLTIPTGDVLLRLDIEFAMLQGAVVLCC